MAAKLASDLAENSFNTPRVTVKSNCALSNGRISICFNTPRVTVKSTKKEIPTVLVSCFNTPRVTVKSYAFGLS